MPIFPADDPSLPSATRARIRPLADSYSSTPAENKKRSDPQSGQAKFLDLWGRVRQTCGGTMHLSEYNAGLATQFFEANRNGTFDYFDFIRKTYTNVLLGTGDGIVTTFTFGGKDVVEQVVRVAGVAKTAGTHYNVSVGTGALGQDQVIFTAGNIPTAGQEVRADARLRALYTMEFLEWSARSGGWDRVVIDFSVQEAFA